MNKNKLLNLGLILTSLMVYLEWGADNNSFLLEVEIELFSKLFVDPMSILHPLTLLPLIGQILLLITLFQKEPSKILSYLGFAGIGLLVILILFVGIISMNFRIVISTIPFLVIGGLIIRHRRNKHTN